MNDVRLKLSPPWITYINQVQALLDGDPEIAININARENSLVIATNNGDKAAALVKLLPSEKTWGNITWTIFVDGPMSNRAFTSNKELFETAFEKNPAFSRCVAPAQDGYQYIDFTYVIFKNCVVQFFNDNLDDAFGNISTLYQDIASEVFENTPMGVHYCTDVERGNLGKPLGEWP